MDSSGGVWSLVRIQSPRLVKIKELSDKLSSFLFSSYKKSTTFQQVMAYQNKKNPLIFSGFFCRLTSGPGGSDEILL